MSYSILSKETSQFWWRMGISRSVEVAWGFKDKGPSRAPSRALPRMYKKSSKIRGHNGINNGHDDGEKSRLETIVSNFPKRL